MSANILADKQEQGSQVDHPAHYDAGGVECIDALQGILEHWGDGFHAFCLGNAIKYLWRAGKKGPWQTDIEKAVWYLNSMLQEDNDESSDS